MDDVEAPEIVVLNEAALDVEELEARLEIASMVPNGDCWANNCGCYAVAGCAVHICP